MKNKRPLPALLATAGLLLMTGSTLAAEEGSKPPLLPSLEEPGTYVQAIWVLVIFLIVVAILYQTAWKNVLTGLKAREARIRGDIADAEAARTKAESTLKEYNTQLATAETQVRELLNKAAVDAEAISKGIQMRAQQEVEELKERANKEIESSKKQALAEIYEQTAELATSVAEKILRRNLNADDQKDLVSQSLEELQTVHA